jgi:hypothetical protein
MGASTRTSGFTTALIAGLTAAARPMVTPSPTAMPKPANSRTKVAAISCRKSLVNSCWPNRKNTAPGGGSSVTGA